MILAIVCTAGSVFLTQKYVQDRLQERDVVVFTKNLPAFTKITGEMIETRRLGVSGLHPQAAGDIREVVGKYILASAVPGEVVLKNKLAAETSLPQGYLYSLQPNERVIAVSTDLIRSVGGTVQPGDRVDLIAVLDDKAGGEPQARTFLQQIQVIDVRDPGARRLSEVVKGNKEETQIINNSGQKLVPGAVVLAVKPFQAEQIALYQKLGEITLTINPKQARVFPSTGVRLSQLRQITTLAQK